MVRLRGQLVLIAEPLFFKTVKKNRKPVIAKLETRPLRESSVDIR
jgi:hypothetical protein